MSNIVYVLTNPAMPGIVKIGKTNRDNPQVRMNELYSTGVPLPFECAIAIETEDEQAAAIEKALHTAFSPQRVNPSREFFEIEPLQVEAILRIYPGKDVTPQVNRETEEELDASDREATERYKSRRTYRSTYMKFGEMGIPTGSVLVSVDTNEEAVVTEDRKVSFRGELVSLTEATRVTLNLKPGRTPQKSTPHWTFDGRNLGEIFDETYRVNEA